MKLKSTLLCAASAMIIGGNMLSLTQESVAAKVMPPVVATDWLADHIEDANLVILHIGRQGSFEEKHIPGACSASLRKIIRVNDAGIRDEMLAEKDLAGICSELGISDSSRIVIYFAEEGAAWAVARYLLTLEYAGMKGRVAYLDGGLPKWVAEERPISTTTPHIDTTQLAVKPAPDVIVDLEWLRARLGRPGIALLDGRPREGYAGEDEHWERPGHIPGAKNIPFSTLLAEKPPYLLKSREDLTDIFLRAGAHPGDTVVVYCGTGLWASLPYLAARHLGYEVRLYDGSYQEWSGRETLPVATSGKNDRSDQ
jgi:thiosulfate/3-mercaptopyruvate sulfurtransferase